MNGRVIRLRNRLKDGVKIDHVITVGDDEVDFRLTAINPTPTDSAVEWSGPSVHLDRFTGAGGQDPRATYPAYIKKCFVFIGGRLTRLPTNPWATEAKYTPGQVYVPPGADVQSAVPGCTIDWDGGTPSRRSSPGPAFRPPRSRSSPGHAPAGPSDVTHE